VAASLQDADGEVRSGSARKSNDICDEQHRAAAEVRPGKDLFLAVTDFSTHAALFAPQLPPTLA
jgi:hypothetical protein